MALHPKDLISDEHRARHPLGRGAVLDDGLGFARSDTWEALKLGLAGGVDVDTSESHWREK